MACGTFLMLQAGSLSAGEWRSSDGVIAVATPDSNRFKTQKSSSPFLARWGSEDEKINLLIKKKAVTPNVKFSQSDLEQGLITEINLTMKNGKLLESTIEKHESYSVLKMTAQGENGKMTLYFTHKIITTSDTQYTAVAVGIGTDTRTDPDTAAFISSFKDLTWKAIDQPGVTVPSEKVPSVPEKTEPIKYQRSEEGMARELGFRIGYGIGQFMSCFCCLAVPIGIIWLLSKVLSGYTR
jgi:hypothetical protein